MSTKYTLGYDANPKKKVYTNGDIVKKILAQCDIEAADNDGDVIIIGWYLPVDTLISAIKVPAAISAITGATDYDIGFYKPNRTDPTDVGDALDADALVDGIDLSGGQAVADILGTNVSSFDRTKTIGDLLSLSVEDQPEGVHLCITLNTAGTAAGVVGLEIDQVCAG